MFDGTLMPAIRGISWVLGQAVALAAQWVPRRMRPSSSECWRRCCSAAGGVRSGTQPGGLVAVESIAPPAQAATRSAEGHAGGMRSRTAGMWWGTAIEAPDPAALARFYSELLGWPVVHEEAGTSVVASGSQGPYFVFQLAAGYTAPVWPPSDGQQRPMMHLDFQVGDLDSAVAEAVALGATVADSQPQDAVRVLFDPAGHPFCLCLDAG